jgi:hypothetical protein
MLAGTSVYGCTLKSMIIIQITTYELELFESRFAPAKVLIVAGNAAPLIEHFSISGRKLCSFQRSNGRASNVNGREM